MSRSARLTSNAPVFTSLGLNPEMCLRYQFINATIFENLDHVSNNEFRPVSFSVLHPYPQDASLAQD